MANALDELEKKLHDSNATPMFLPLEFLKAITSDFSSDMVLGEGGFGVVYKGVLQSGKIIAVKKLFEMRLKEETFQNEVCYLIRIKHKNIVKLVGYCAESTWEAIEHPGGSGKHILAEMPKRLLCFEYISNKSLDKYISDESLGLQWNIRFEIIKGICEGLHFLHEECRLVHLDLKPENILMDSTMTPKIADFGLSRIFGEQKSRTITKNRAGTRGYMAPEYLIHGVVSNKADIFSLGVIVIEIITGRRDYPTFQQNNPQRTASSLQQFTEKVLGNWRNKFLSISKNKSMEIYTQQVHECIAIALRCVDPIMESRPTAKNIIQMLNAVQQVIAVSSDLLDVHPLELRIPIELNKLIKCSLHLTNNNDKQVVFRLIEKRYNCMCFLKLPQYGIVPPRSTYTLFVTTRKNESLPKERSVDLILQSSISEDYVMPFRLGYYCDQYFEKAKMLDNAVHNVALKAIYAQQGETTYEANPPLTQIISLEKTWENYIYSVDFHRKEPWILTRHHHDIDIWNYQTKTLMGSVRTHDFVCSLKFIERKEWFVVTSERNLSRERSRERGLTRERSVSRERNVSIDGFICVYNYKTGVKIIKSFHVGQTQVHGETPLAVHPTKPYVLSACGGWIKLWDWDKNWECIQTSEEQSDYTLHLTFNPNDTNSFASSSKAGEITIWSLDLLKPKYTLYGHSSRVRCLDFFTRDDQQYLITGSADKTAKIWDMQTKECVYTLEGLMSTVRSVFSHPSIPVLVTGTEMGDIHLWGAANFRLQKTIRLGEHGSCFIGKCTLSNRVLIVNDSELWIHDEEPDAGHGSNPIEKV